jgi:hypothetical protein
MYISASADDVGVPMAARFFFVILLEVALFWGCLCTFYAISMLSVYLPLLTIEWLDQSS